MIDCLKNNISALSGKTGCLPGVFFATFLTRQKSRPTPGMPPVDGPCGFYSLPSSQKE